jgi:hypothetical protein
MPAKGSLLLPAVLFPPDVPALVWLPAAVWFPAAVIPVALPAVVALVDVIFCCAMAVSLPIRNNNPDMSAAAANIPAIGIAALALTALLLLHLSDLLRIRIFINANERK